MRYLPARLLILNILIASSAQAQPSDGVRWFMSVADADTVEGEARAYRLYGTPTQIDIEFLFSNESEKPLIATQSDLNRDLIVNVPSDEALTTIAEWDSEPLLDSGHTPVLADTEVTVYPGKGVLWIVHLRHADESPFTAGRYTVEVTAGLSRARTPDEKAWISRLVEGRSASIVVICGAPSNAPERIAAHHLVARKAQSEGRFNDSLAAIQLALSVDPTHRQSLISLGYAYLILGRFRDAIGPLEQAVAMGWVSMSLADALAHAYVGVKDEQNATRVLLNSGIVKDRIPDKLAELRGIVAKRRRP